MKDRKEGAVKMPFLHGKGTMTGIPINLTWVKIKNIIKKCYEILQIRSNRIW